MQAQVFCQMMPVAELFSEAWKQGVISSNHRDTLQDVLLDYSLTQDDRDAIDRLFHAVRRGWLKVAE